VSAANGGLLTGFFNSVFGRWVFYFGSDQHVHALVYSADCRGVNVWSSYDVTEVAQASDAELP
jgi:hypothetical protein